MLVVWATLITNTNYLPGVIVLDYCLRKVGSAYPLVALYTDNLPDEAHKAIDARHIAKRKVDRLLPGSEIETYTEPRFLETWTKLSAFGMTEYERVVLLDSDMVILQNMDELMAVPLDGPEQEGKGDRAFAASHACTCNPLKKPHYPKNWCVSISSLRVASWYVSLLTESAAQQDSRKLRLHNSARTPRGSSNRRRTRDRRFGLLEFWSARDRSFERHLQNNSRDSPITKSEHLRLSRPGSTGRYMAGAMGTSPIRV